MRKKFNIIKSHVNNLVHNAKQRGENIVKEDVARSFQDAVIKCLVSKSENAILNRIKNRVKPGGIILLHDTSAKTVSVLEQLLLFLQSEGYQTVTIEELLEISAYEN